MNGTNVQAKKPICKCLLVAAAVVCVCVPSVVCLFRADHCVCLLVTAVRADAAMTPRSSPHPGAFAAERAPYTL